MSYDNYFVVRISVHQHIVSISSYNVMGMSTQQDSVMATAHVFDEIHES